MELFDALTQCRVQPLTNRTLEWRGIRASGSSLRYVLVGKQEPPFDYIPSRTLDRGFLGWDFINLHVSNSSRASFCRAELVTARESLLLIVATTDKTICKGADRWDDGCLAVYVVHVLIQFLPVKLL